MSGDAARTAGLRRSLRAQHGVRQRLNHWVSRTVVPGLINNAAALEMAGRRIAEGRSGLSGEMKAAVQARPLLLVGLAALIGYMVAGRRRE